MIAAEDKTTGKVEKQPTYRMAVEGSELVVKVDLPGLSGMQDVCSQCALVIVGSARLCRAVSRTFVCLLEGIQIGTASTADRSSVATTSSYSKLKSVVRHLSCRLTGK